MISLINTTINIIDVKASTYINSSKKINDENLKFKIGDIARLSKHKKHFCKRLCFKFV